MSPGMMATSDRGGEPRLDIALVSRKVPQNDALGVAYLVAAARQAGLRIRRFQLNRWTELDLVGSELMACQPRVIGLSLPDGGSAPLLLALGALVSGAGHRGAITAGGPFATLARHWLLERYPWLGSVVRFAGEVPLVELARELGLAAPDLSRVPGLTTRLGDGAPAPVLAAAPLELQPVRDELPQVVGRPMAHIAATRGCPGRCAYCGPAALQRQERQEGERAGHSSHDLARAGVGGVRRRPVAGLCDEMAQLWHERAVRYFYFTDEHLLPHSEEAALAYLREWKAGLAEREVGPLGIGCMLRADFVTPRMLEAFAELGLVRVFLGVELVSGADQRCFGRGGNAERALGTLRHATALGVATSCNLMLVHPYLTQQTLAQAMDVISALPDLCFEATRMEAYHGTELQERLEREGRLVGNPLRYDYRFDDPVLERFDEIFTRLRFEAFGDYSLTCRDHDVALALALTRRIAPLVPLSDLLARHRTTGAAAGRLRAQAYAEAFALARIGASPAEVGALLARARDDSERVARDFDDVHGALLARLGRAARPFTPLRSAAGRLMSFCLAGAAVAACQQATSPSEPPGMLPSVASPGLAEGGPPDGGRVAGLDTTAPPPTGSAIPPQAPSATPGCTAERARALEPTVEQLVVRVEPCSSRQLVFGTGPSGRPLEVRSKPGGEAVDRRIEQTVRAELSPPDFVCLVQYASIVAVLGGEMEQEENLRSAIGPCADEMVVQLDGSGRVVSVTSHGKVSPSAQACVNRVLSGLRFPCLANRSVAWSKYPPVMME